MKIKVVAVGKLKDGFNSAAIEEYRKRISRFADVEIKEVAEVNFVKTPNLSESLEIMRREGEGIEKELSGKTVVLDIDGKELSSVELSEKMQKLFMESSEITFIVGGSYGIDKKIKDKADFRLSFSKMTFPHGLFRVMLLEQIYRALTIKEHLPYHK